MRRFANNTQGKLIENYFCSVAHGLPCFLPGCRNQNRAFLLNLYEAFKREPRFTAYDLSHALIVLGMADRMTFPPITDVKTLAQAEAFLIQSLPRFNRKKIRLALEWVFLLLARHDRVEADLSVIRPWLSIWRMVQAFHAVEQGFLSDCIRWMLSKEFAPRSILDILQEYRKFKTWMSSQCLDSLGQVGNAEIQRYLLERAYRQTNGSKGRILGNLRTVLHYYKDAIDGGFRLPDCTIKVSRMPGTESSARGDEIARLWDALQTRWFPAMAALMLALILSYGLSLRALPLLRMKEPTGRLLWTERLPCRRGVREQEIQLDLGMPWLADLWERVLRQRKTHSDYPYLFTSGHSRRRQRPVSVDFCQKAVQDAVQGVLGYPIPVNNLERGAFKRLARQKPLTEFMHLTAQAPKSRLTRLMYWLAQG